MHARKLLFSRVFPLYVPHVLIHAQVNYFEALTNVKFITLVGPFMYAISN